MFTNRYNAQTNQGYSDGADANYFSNLRPDLQKLNRKITTNDVPHRLAANFVYDLPIGDGRLFDNKMRVVNSIVGGWRIGGAFVAQSGRVATLRNGGTNSINGLPDLAPGVPLEVPKDLQKWYDGKTSVTLPSGRVITPCKGCFLKYNIDAFAGWIVTGPNGKAIPDLFWYGSSAATFDGMRSNPIWNMNMSLEKSFTMWERYAVSVAAQATNVFNHVQFKPTINSTFGATVVQSTLDNAANAPLKLKLGQLLDTASTFGTFTQDAYDARQIEVVLKFRF